ncbi:SLC13 family permease [Rheinheimera sp. NSM]|uniref:SLC13 family permease n=1 Tax=Rheinheimera sp. NSM TaxID=3457884 RepID=UPI00403590E8
MTLQQGLLFAILFSTVALFIWGRWRHDTVALATLMAAVAAGLVPAETAFSGFGHPAVITVACVLVLSYALQHSGAVDLLARKLLPASSGVMASIALLTALVTVLSAFMNNVGAMALMMPVAIQAATRLNLTPGQVLMPVSFGSILGGMTTLIGTPPNLIVSGFRHSSQGSSFAMFDFSPVGVLVALAGVAFIALIGWRLVPQRQQSGAEGFDTASYLTEVRVDAKGKADGLRLAALEQLLEEADAQVVGLVRNKMRVSAPTGYRMLKADDVLVIEAEPESLGNILAELGLTLEENVKAEAGSGAESNVNSSGGEEILLELAVLPDAQLIGRSAADLSLRSRFGINLLALSRQGNRSIKRLRRTELAAGDVLLMQGDMDVLAAFASEFGCVPLAERSIQVPDKKRIWLTGSIMLFAVGGAALGLVPAAISFAAGVLASMLFKAVPLRKVYQAIDWPVVVLLAALIPVAEAMLTTGAAGLLAEFMLQYLSQGSAVIALVLLLVLTMTLSDFMNNAATAAVMCPIAVSIARQLDVSSDSFLMAVAIGASCAFLTPIGHQNNTLILGPGGFKFGDYWRLGLPLEILVVSVSVPALLWFWPL